MSPKDPTIERLLVHGEFLRRIARRLLGRDDLADDIVQDAWVAALENPPRRPGSWRAWLTGVTRNLARQARRGEGRRARREQVVARREGVPSPEDVTARLQLEQQLVEAVSQLPEPYRTAVLLRYLDDLPVSEVAARLDVPLETVRTRLRRGLEMLRGRLDAERFDWRTVLIPIALPSMAFESTAAAAVGGTTLVTSGVWIMTLWKIGLAGVALALGLWWMLASDDAVPRTRESERRSARDSAEMITVEPGVASSRVDGSQMSGRTDANPAEADRPSKSDHVTTASRTEAAYEIICEREPVPGALVWLLRSGSVLAKQRTDGRGRFQIEALGGTGRVVVFGESRAPEVVEASFEAGEHVLELVGAQEVSGRLVFSVPPEEPVGLELVSDIPWPTRYELAEHDGDEAAALIEQEPVMKQRVAADGEFRFTGLPPKWSGKLQLPLAYVFERSGALSFDDIARRVSLSQPTSGLAMDVHRRPHLHGRVVEADEIRAVAGAHIGGSLSYAEGSARMTINIHSLRVWTDEEGQFRLPFFSGRTYQETFQFEQFRLRVSRDGSNYDSSFVIEEGDIGVDGDLGVFRMPPGREIRFIVWDRSGRPIRGARALAGVGGRFGTSEPTDSLGEGRVIATEDGDTTIRVVALGYDPVLIDVPAEQVTPVDVVLDPGAMIDIRVRSSRATTFQASSLQLEFEPGLFVRLSDNSWEFESPDVGFQSVGGARWTGASLEMSERRKVSFRLTETSRTEARCLLPGVVPGKSFTASLKAPDGTILGQHSSDGVAAGEHREIVIEVTAKPKMMRGRITDPLGGPCRGAIVQLAAGKGSISAPTDAFGRFVIEPLYGGPYTMTVSCEGFTDLIREGLELPERPIELTLTR
ncbi:MAG: sigma-70 family RNA polymerase sigma factor [Planctomycetota bacterium]